jgi:hypothetical protein
VAWEEEEGPSSVGERLTALRHILEHLTVKPCRLAHERVVFDHGVAERRHVNGVASFVRIGLCDWNARVWQLACAHTTARHRLLDVISALASLGVITQGEANHMEERVESLANAIHLPIGPKVKPKRHTLERLSLERSTL